MTEKKKLVLVDGSGYLFRAFYALPHLKASDGTPISVVYGVVKMLQRLLKDQRPDYFVVVFDGRKKTFRHEIYPAYKNNRPPTPPDIVRQFHILVDIIDKLAYPMLQIEGYEADDVLGTLARRACAQAWDVVIASSDKDLMQLVQDDIRLFDPAKNKFFGALEVQEKLGVMPQQVVDYLTLAGDSSDNIPGVRKVGPKTAAGWLAEYGSIENLLAQCDKCRQKIEAGVNILVEDLDLYRRLVTIDCEVPLAEDLESYRLGEPDWPALEAIYTRLGMQSLLN